MPTVTRAEIDESHAQYRGAWRLLALGSPFLGATWGSVDERVLPVSSPSRQAADLQATLFGGETSTASIMVR